MVGLLITKRKRVKADSSHKLHLGSRVQDLIFYRKGKGLF
uniref:Uncharacterized protein n=1 Tax=Utricularia reniformis TaxID=192314 RepID=A0A1Y0B0J6_9LAMI|nr:hypothetical protein AEK19_MT0673 [Utricularia reniformis]ART30923.1 hypothetical protein AEK19_MT0673 [Utricularia reniformis]